MTTLDDVHILYIEDDGQSREIMRVLVEEMLGLRGLVIFQDSEAFLERVHALSPKPDVIFLDIHVPPHDGFEMLSMLRSDGFRDTPVVALTASVMNEEVHRLRTAGFDGIIAKPVDLDTFPTTLNQIIARKYGWNLVN